MLDPSIPGSIVALLFRRVGDSLLATPALRALKDKYPDRSIRVISEPQTIRVFEGLPYIDEIVECPRSPSAFHLQSQIRKGGGAAATIDFLSNPRTAIACRLSGTSVRVGFAIGLRKFFYTHRVALQDQTAPVYSAIHKLRLAEQIAATTTNIFPDFVLTQEDNTLSSIMWQKAGLSSRGVVALFISSRRSYKRWPLESFEQLVERLREQQIQEIILVGGANEESEMRDFAKAADLPPERVLACNTLGVLTSVIKRATVLIGNDGGPKHLACAVGTATVTIFRHDPPEYWTPPQHRLHVALRSDAGANIEEIANVAIRVYREALT